MGGKDKKGKKKALPGDKIKELQGLDADHMLSVLIENHLVVRTRSQNMMGILGSFNYLGTMHHQAEYKESDGPWTPQDPSIAQIKQALIEYCVLPNGSTEIKMALQPELMVKSLCLFGPSGSGKTMAVEAVANELGALLIHLSPDKLRGQFSGKTGPTKLVHMAFTVARDPAFQPCIIYIDECEQFFAGGKKSKADKDGPSRFKKDLTTYKNNALGPEHRVMVIGTSNAPENGEVKDMKNFFDKFLYMPYPDYATRVGLWEHYIREVTKDRLNTLKNENDQANNNAAAGSTTMTQEQKLAEMNALIAEVEQVTRSIDCSSLAYISEGYSAG